MIKILLIQTSPKGENSFSRKAAMKLIEKFKKCGPTQIVERDLATEVIPHINGLTISAFYSAPDQHSVEQKEAIALSDQLVSEVLDADKIVISTPMWNFGLPSILKAWMDHIVRAGRTFRFTEKGLEGLLKGKKVFVIVSSGSIFSSGPFSSYDHLAPYFKSAFGFMGVTDVEIVRVEGTNDPKVAESAFAKAQQQIDALQFEF